MLRIKSIALLAIVGVTGCSKSNLSVKQRLINGDKLYSISGSCDSATAPSGKPDGYLALEKNAVIVVSEGDCKSKVKFTTDWLRDNRVRLTKPKDVEICAGARPADVHAELILSFVSAGTDIKLFSSQQRSCRWMRWRKG